MQGLGRVGRPKVACDMQAVFIGSRSQVIQQGNVTRFVFDKKKHDRVLVELVLKGETFEVLLK